MGDQAWPLTSIDNVQGCSIDDWDHVKAAHPSVPALHPSAPLEASRNGGSESGSGSKMETFCLHQPQADKK